MSVIIIKVYEFYFSCNLMFIILFITYQNLNNNFFLYNNNNLLLIDNTILFLPIINR